MAGAWDAVVTCFFIDTAHNIVEYLEVIARALKPGGVCLRNLKYSVCIKWTYSGCGMIGLYFASAFVI